MENNDGPKLRPEFGVHFLNARGAAIANDIAQVFSGLVDYLEALGITGREKAVVITKLQEACFFAKKSVALIPENQHGYTPPEPTEADKENLS